MVREFLGSEQAINQSICEISGKVLGRFFAVSNLGSDTESIRGRELFSTKNPPFQKLEMGNLIV